MIERPCKSSADQKIELLVFEKLCNPFRANFFTDPGVNDFDGTMADRAANDVYAVPISARSISEPAQEFGALRWQSERNRNHRSRSLWFSYGMPQEGRIRYFGVASTICTTKLFFSPAAGVASVAGIAFAAVALAKVDGAGFSSGMDVI